MLHTFIDPREAEALELAGKLLAGITPDDRADTKADWLAAAQRAVDGEADDLIYFMDRAEAYDDFADWSERHDPAGNYSFDDWYRGMVGVAA